MPQRMAAIFSMLAFAMCLVVGLQADNTFTTTVVHALVAMVGTFVVGLILGAMGQKMLTESVNPPEPEKSKDLQAKPGPKGR